MERANVSMQRFFLSRRKLLKAAGITPAALLLSTEAFADDDADDRAQIQAWADIHVNPPGDRSCFVDFSFRLWKGYVAALSSFDNTNLDKRKEVLAEALLRSGNSIHLHLDDLKKCGIKGTLTCAILCAHKSKQKKTLPWGKVNGKTFYEAWEETKREVAEIDPDKGLAC